MPHVELPQVEFKVVMLGETFTGKTSLVLRFAEGYYRDSSRKPTVGAFFTTKRLCVQGMTVKIQIWDTAGQEQFKRLAPMYYKNAAAAILCYDVTSPKSFETLEYWMRKLKQNVATGKIVIALCATKCDLATNPDTSLAEKLAEETNSIFMTTSSKNNSNVQLLFQKVTERVLEYKKEDHIKKNNSIQDKLKDKKSSNNAATKILEITSTKESNWRNNNISNDYKSLTSPPTDVRCLTSSSSIYYDSTVEANFHNPYVCIEAIQESEECENKFSENRNFDEEKKNEQDIMNVHEKGEPLGTMKNVIELAEKKDSTTSAADKTVVQASRCDINMLMCSDVVGLASEDASIMKGCVTQ